MNIERLTQLANDLEAHHNPKFKFDIGIVSRQKYCHEGCGTVGCIAGFIMWKYLDAKYPAESEYASMHPVLPNGEIAQDWHAGTWLDLPAPVWDALFYNFNSAPDDLQITEKDSAKVIRHLIETGIVDWSILHEDA